MSPLKKVGRTYTTYQGMYGASSSLPVKMVENITSGRDVVKPVPIKFAEKSDFQTQVDMLTKAFTSEMANDAMKAKSDKLRYCGAMSSQHGIEEHVPDKLLDRRKKYNSMRNELYKRSQIVSSYLSKYTKDKEKEKEKEKERNAAAGMRRTKKYDHIQSKVDTNLRKYTSLTSLDTLKGHEQTRTQSAISSSKRTSSVENLSALNQRRVRSARNADEYKYLKPIQGLKPSQQQLSTGTQKDEQSHKNLFSNSLEAFKTLPMSSAERLNFYSARFCRERLKKYKPEDRQQSTTGMIRNLPISRQNEDNKESASYSTSMLNLDKLKARENLMSDELACIKSSYESMADQLRKTSNPVLTRPSNSSEPIRSPRLSLTTHSSTFDPTPLYQKSSDLQKTSSGVRLASNTYFDRNRSNVTGSLTEEYLKDVNNSINTYLGGGKSSHVVNNRVNYKSPESHGSGGGRLYKSMSMDFKIAEPSEYGIKNKNNNRLKRSDSSEYSQLKETLCEASRRLGVSLPSVSTADDTQETSTATVTTTASPTTNEDSLRIHNWIDSISAQDEETKEKEISAYKRPLSGVWSQHSNDSEENRPTSALLKSKWLSKSMPSDLDDSRSVKSILKKKKRVRINLECNKTYLFKSECDV